MVSLKKHNETIRACLSATMQNAPNRNSNEMNTLRRKQFLVSEKRRRLPIRLSAFLLYVRKPIVPGSILLPVQNVMLKDEKDVKDDGNLGQIELDGIPDQSRPVLLERCIDQKLSE